MTWFEKIMPSRIKTERRTRSVPEGLWMKCAACDAVLYRAELERNINVCPKCGHHMRIGARERRWKRSSTRKTGVELADDIEPEDPLKFRDSKKYRDRLQQAQKATQEKDALIVMAGTLHAQAGRRVRVRGSNSWPARWARSSASASCAPSSIPSSIARRSSIFRRAAVLACRPALLSLLQMAKTSSALARLSQARLAVHLGDDGSHDRRRVGEPCDARRCEHRRAESTDRLRGHSACIQQTVRETLPEGFQRSEFLLEHGALDMIVDRRDMRDRIGSLLRHVHEVAGADSLVSVNVVASLRLADWLSLAGDAASAARSTWGSSGCSARSERLELAAARSVR